jgi:FkbM family methyltransferase
VAAAAVAFGRRGIEVDGVEISFRNAFVAMNGSINTQLPTVAIDSLYGPLAAFENDFVTRQIAEYGSHTRNEIAMLRHFIDAGDLVYDIGAHIGMFAIPLAEAVGDDGRVIAVEADPNNFPLLWQNLRSRDLIGRVAALPRCMASLAHRAVGTRPTERNATRARRISWPTPPARRRSHSLWTICTHVSLTVGARPLSRSMSREWSFRFCARPSV